MTDNLTNDWNLTDEEDTFRIAWLGPGSAAAFVMTGKEGFCLTATQCREAAARLIAHADKKDGKGAPMTTWTRDDLPSADDIPAMWSDRIFGVIPTLDAVVEHLNTHHPKPGMCAHELVIGGRLIAPESQYKRERDEWKARAEAVEARTAPAVTRADIEKALDDHRRMAFGVPVVSVEEATEIVCDLFGIEAAVDPVEAKARELWEVVKPSDYATWSGTNEKAKDQFRKVAAHVLGQEAER